MKKNCNLGDKLRFARKYNKYSQKYVCEHFGIKQSTFSSWERGVAEPNLSMIFELCRLYEIEDIEEFLKADSIDDFFTSKVKISSSDEKFIDVRIESLIEQRLIENFRRLDERGKSAVMNCLKCECDFLKQDESIPKILSISFGKSHKYAMRDIRVYTQPAAAGLGNYLDDESDFQIIQAEVPTSADVGIRISGDSMQPTIESGSIAWVKRCDVVENGEIGIFILNGNAYCKILKQDKNGICLKSVNPNYADIRIVDGDSLTVYGKVIF